MQGTLHSIQVSRGGVPKLPVATATVETDGLTTDRQKHRKFHGGPTRAVSLLGLDVIESLQKAGHPITPGATGENLTIAGLTWADVPVGSIFRFEGGVQLRVLSHAKPCPAIRGAFGAPADIVELDHRENPGQARLYASVDHAGTLSAGEAVTVVIS